ncbi:MAG: type II and III secretion system protein family protein [Terriglobales bacterium]
MRRPANIIRLRLEVSPLGVALRFALLATVVSLSVSIIASATDWQDAAPANTPPATSNPPTLPAASDQRSEPSGSAPLRVMVGKSLLVNTTERLKRVSVTDPGVADAIVVTPTQILIHGRSPGEVSLLIWDELERSQSFDLRVDVDVSAATEEEKRIFPDEQINVSASRSAIVLSGHVTTEDVAKKAGQVAEAYTKNVVNVLTFGPVGAQEVLLQVKFAEVDRSALKTAGINLFSTGITNTIGTTTTGQFGGFGPQQITDTVGQTAPFAVNQTVSNVLNIFLFRPDIHMGAVINDLENKNILQILAEPNLIAVNGKEASFLAGGEFPFPIVQPGNGFTSVTISFKEFGVRLKFTPLIMPNGDIHLRVQPEVSTLDFTNALTISGFTVPALSTRRADTEFEVKDGQSFVIAGLMDNRVTDVMNKIPGLGDIPVLGAFFRSKSAQKSKTELMVLCTVQRVQPDSQPSTPPAYPRPFLDKQKFDKTTPSGAAK